MYRNVYMCPNVTLAFRSLRVISHNTPVSVYIVFRIYKPRL